MERPIVDNPSHYLTLATKFPEVVQLGLADLLLDHPSWQLGAIFLEDGSPYCPTRDVDLGLLGERNSGSDADPRVITYGAIMHELHRRGVNPEDLVFRNGVKILTTDEDAELQRGESIAESERRAFEYYVHRVLKPRSRYMLLSGRLETFGPVDSDITVEIELLVPCPVPDRCFPLGEYLFIHREGEACTAKVLHRTVSDGPVVWKSLLDLPYEHPAMDCLGAVWRSTGCPLRDAVHSCQIRLKWQHDNLEWDSEEEWEAYREALRSYKGETGIFWNRKPGGTRLPTKPNDEEAAKAPHPELGS